MRIVDPWNPSPDEVRAWAYTPGAAEPCEDWELALCWSRHEAALLETASDEGCPNRRYMLGVLYFLVGHAVRDGFRSLPRPMLEGFLHRADAYGHPDIREWQRRSRELLRDPSSLDQAAWCGGRGGG